MAKVIEVKYFNTIIVKGVNSENFTWHIEESRIKGGYNNTAMDLGVRAYTTNQDFTEQRRANTLIYSGIYNSRTGVNNTNQFSVGENITKSLDIQNGSIQKLFSEDSALTVFQEEKVSWIPVDKDIIYTAEGEGISASANVFLGDTVSYTGNYGISTHPESFASYAGRKYFADAQKGVVLRLSRDGMTEVSNYGMRSYFRDNMSRIKRVYGAWDAYGQDYVISLYEPIDEVNNNFTDYDDTHLYFGSLYRTLVFDESVNGWVSHRSYPAVFAGSLDSSFYTFNFGDLYKQNSTAAGVLNNNFHGTQYNSEVSLIFNDVPSQSKVFSSINYEGDSGWSIANIETDVDTGMDISSTLTQSTDSIIYLSGFQKIDGKYNSNIINTSSAEPGEIVFGNDISGVKGFFAKFTIKTTGAASTTNTELFAVSTNFNINSY
jgi:hypothetical protein